MDLFSKTNNEKKQLTGAEIAKEKVSLLDPSGISKLTD